MHIEVSGQGYTVTPQLRGYLVGRLRRALAGLLGQHDLVRISVEDVRSRHVAVDLQCRLRGPGPGVADVEASAFAASLSAAVDTAAARVRRRAVGAPHRASAAPAPRRTAAARRRPTPVASHGRLGDFVMAG